MNAIHRIFRHGGFIGCERGAIAVEFALILPVLTAMVFGLLEYSQAVHQSIALEHAARAGAEYALQNPTDTTGIQAAVAGAGTVQPTNLTVTSTQFCECPDGTSIDCASTCTGSVLPNEYVRVAVAQPAQDPLATAGVLSGRVVSASATLRLR